MLKNMRLLLNNMNEKPYVNGKVKFKLYSDSGKNLTPLARDSKEMQRIDYLETTARYNNLKVYLSNMLKLRGKQLALIVTPILLGSLTIQAWVFPNYIKKEVLPTYQKQVIEMDEEHLYKDGFEPDIYVLTVDKRTFSKETDAKSINRYYNTASIYFGEGEKALQAQFHIENDNTWTLNSYNASPYFDLEDKDADNAKDIPKKYEELINEAANILKSNLAAEDTELSDLIDEMITNNKNDIVLQIQRYEKIGDREYETMHSNWLWKMVLVIFDFFIGWLLWYRFSDLSTVYSIYSSKGKLDEGRVISIIHAAMKYRATLLQAETERIEEIDSIIRKHNGTGEILSKFEKKLIK